VDDAQTSSWERRREFGYSAEVLPLALAPYKQALSDWAQNAHEELQEQLDVAFSGRRWRKLGWWKLFWRVDDVGMLSSEMLTQRFLPEAQNNIIYLAGRINEVITMETKPRVTQHQERLAAPQASEDRNAKPSPESVLGERWPTQIPSTRNYLLDESVPALQALAQKLVAQTLGTSALTSSLAGLAYLSSFGAYEAAAVAALGIVWSLRRMQNKWETARSFWEGEVREEGRKAVRSVEVKMSNVLDGVGETTEQDVRMRAEFDRARTLLQDARDAFSRLK
jgi:hypothetical protein